MTLPERMALIRKHKGIIQEDIAERLNINQSGYSEFENPKTNLKFNTITKIAKALDCSVAFLIDVESEIYDEEEWLKSRTNQLD